MIKYKNILEQLNAAGYSLQRIRQENLLSQSVLTRIRSNKPVTTETLDKLCHILQCDISDLIEFHSDVK